MLLNILQCTGQPSHLLQPSHAAKHCLAPNASAEAENPCSRVNNWDVQACVCVFTWECVCACMWAQRRAVRITGVSELLVVEARLTHKQAQQ